LQRKFPRRAELSALLEFARAEKERLEHKKELEAAIESINKKLDAGKVRDALNLAEKSLLRFTGNPDLEALATHARAKQKEIDNKALLQKRIAEIQRNIKSGQHTNAADLARQTLATLGHDSQVNQLLRAAEVELEEKRKKKEEHDKRVAQAQSKLDEGRFDAATQILRDGIETKILSRTDPRVKEMFAELEAREKAAASPGALPDSRTPAGRDSSGTMATDFVHQESTILGSVPNPQHAPPANDLSAGEFSATIVLDSRNQAAARTASDRPAEVVASNEKSQASSDVGLNSGIVRPEASALPRHSNPSTKRGVMIAVGALALMAAGGAAFYFNSQKHANDESAIRDHAEQLEQQKNWPEALKEYENLAGSGGALASFGSEHASTLKARINHESSLISKARADESKGNLPEAKQLYQQAAGLHGDREQEALSSLQSLSSRVVVPQPPPASKQPVPELKPSKTAKAPEPLVAQPKPTQQVPPPAPAPAPTPAPVARNCQLIPSDIPIYLDRAEQNRAGGNYADAERQFNAVLECDPQNTRALAGFSRTKDDEKVGTRPN
jgi:hypothetical protein